jgi:hypothetical protein
MTGMRMHASPLCNESIDATCEAVGVLLSRARQAAEGACPQYRPFWNWWSGTGPEAAYRNLHYAEAAIARLYNPQEVAAEVTDVVRRVNASLPAGHPARQLANTHIKDRGVLERRKCTATDLSFLIALGHEAADRNRAKLRTFRNVMLFGTFVMTFILACVVIVAARHPNLMPLCFTHDSDPRSGFIISCPTGEGLDIFSRGPSGADAFIIALMGVIGGALSGAIFIRGMSSNPTPYNEGYSRAPERA